MQKNFCVTLGVTPSDRKCCPAELDPAELESAEQRVVPAQSLIIFPQVGQIVRRSYALSESSFLEQGRLVLTQSLYLLHFHCPEGHSASKLVEHRGQHVLVSADE